MPEEESALGRVEFVVRVRLEVVESVEFVYWTKPWLVCMG